MSHFNSGPAKPAAYTSTVDMAFNKRERQDDDDDRPRKLQRNHSDQLRQLRGERGSIGAGRRQRQNRSKFLEENSKKWLAWNVQLRPAACPNVHRVTTGTVVRALEPEPLKIPPEQQAAGAAKVNKILNLFDSDDE